MEFIEEEKRQKQELKQVEKRLKELQDKADELRKELKEKEQEQRISTYKLNELRRSLKHNQLKPIVKSGEGSDGEEKLTLNNKTLKKHNQQVR